MRRLVRRLLLALFLILSPGLAGARALTVALQLEPPTLDPTSGAAAAIDEVTYGTIFEPLVRLDAQGNALPWLATGWSVSADGLIYTFRLRAGVRFHDGTPFDAGTAAFSLARIAAPGSTNAQAAAFAVVARVEAVAPLVLRVTLRSPDADFPRLLSYGDAAMVSPASAGSLATRPIGTGPFRFAGWRRGEAIALARDDRYWGTPARVGGVTFRFIADASAAYAAIKAHDVDIMPDFPAPETLDQLRADPSLKVTIGPTQGEVILAFNKRAGPLADLRVRRAISYALDRRAIIDGAMFGYGVPIGSHFPPQDSDYVDLTGRYPHDPAAARRLLAEAGYPEGFALTLKLPPPAYARRSGEIVAAELGAVGIRVAIRNVEWAQWLDEVYARHAFDLTIVDHAEPYDYDIYGRDGYYFGPPDPVVRALLERSRLTSAPAPRRALLQALQRRLADTAANGFLFEFPRLGVQDARLEDVWVNTPNQSIDIAGARFAGDADDGSDGAGGAGAGRLAGWIAVALVGIALAVLAGAVGPRLLARRLGIAAATLLAASALVFALVQIAPGDPAAYMMGLDASPRAVAALHAELGLDGPAWARYLRWLAGMARGDLGLSYTYRVPVAAMIGERVAVSLPLALLATLLSVAIGVPAGVLAARGRGGALDRLLGWAARIGIAVPSFWLAILLVLLFAVRLRWLPAGGFPGWSAGWPALAALTLPILALGLPQAAILARVTRAALIETLGQDYLRTARAKGLSADAALVRHALPNALGPVVTVLGLQLPFLLAGGAIVETVFFLPGLGRLLLQAIAQRDLVTVQAVVMLLVGATILASMIADLALAALDPPAAGRMRRGDAELALGAGIVALAGAAALLSLVWTPHNPAAVDIAARLLPVSPAHPLGTDQLGRDLVSTIMAGARVSLAVSVLAVGAALLVGVPLGLLAAARGGWIDMLAMRGADVLFAFPALLLAILLTAMLGPGAVNAVLAIALFNVPVFARVARGAALPLWRLDFVAAATLAGKRRVAISLEHILPNIAAILGVQAAIQLSLALIAEAGLSYVGLGVQPPAPSWGRMLADAQTLIGAAPRLAIVPGAAILLVVLGFTLLGDGLRDRLDRRR